MRRMPISITIGAVLAASLMAAPAGAAPEPKWPHQAPSPGANAVVAVVDTGINPYHETFRDDSAQASRPPWTYIPGYPKDATALHLTLDAKDYAAAVHADCERVWSKIKPGKLYWVPGTKIIGAISFAPQAPLNCEAEVPAAEGRILDANGHGTMTASRATSFQYGACHQCRVVSVQFPNSVPPLDPSSTMPQTIDSIKWAAANSGWIDAQSNSWGPIAPAYDPTGQTGLFTANQDLIRAVEEVSKKHLAFWASGNGAAFRFGALGHPTLLSPHLAPHAISVGGVDSGYVTAWSGFPPHLVSDDCNSWGAYRDKLHESADTVGSGTSSATPFAAGGATRILLDARSILGDGSTGVHGGVVARGQKGVVKSGPLADGKFTLEEWKRLTFVTASARPEAHFEDGSACGPTSAPYNPEPVKWSDVPDGFPEYLDIGYGAVDADSFALADKILRGLAEAPDRSSTDAYFEKDQAIREQLYELYTTP
jgi:subtilase family protein